MLRPPFNPSRPTVWEPLVWSLQIVQTKTKATAALAQRTRLWLIKLTEERDKHRANWPWQNDSRLLCIQSGGQQSHSRNYPPSLHNEHKRHLTFFTLRFPKAHIMKFRNFGFLPADFELNLESDSLSSRLLRILCYSYKELLKFKIEN
jgi:hypothetical protein